jgi:hypothetical protein
MYVGGGFESGLRQLLEDDVKLVITGAGNEERYDTCLQNTTHM